MTNSMADFRRLPQFDVAGITENGKNIGRKVYWRLHAIENLYRTIIHSVLLNQIGRNWWTTAADPNIQNKANNRKQDYSRHPWHSMPGVHYMYYVDLKDLNEIVRANSNLFTPVIPDIDQWVLKIEMLRLPRNVVAHMNFPKTNDRGRIELLYGDFKALIKELEKSSSLLLKSPR